MSGERLLKICRDCGGEYKGGPTARFCPDCRKRHVGQSSKSRRLCDIGAQARWHPKADKPEWDGPSAELIQKEGS